MAYHRRAGFTIIELLVVIGIITTVVALSVVAVMKARDTAVRTQSVNNLKQIVLAVHHFADSHNGRLPTVGDVILPHAPPINGIFFGQLPMPKRALFVEILPYIDQPNVPRHGGYRPIPVYVSPADPTAQAALAARESITSYACNGRVFNPYPRMPSTFVDGMSNTIAFAEHYAKCDQTYFYYGQSSFPGHRASFADDGDIAPVTTGNPPVSLDPHFPWLTFQTRPPFSRCNSGMAQTPHSGGMLVALADGSVRQIAPNVKPSTFWALVTPASGEVIEDW